MNIPKRLIAVKYSAKRYGIAEPGQAAFLFITPAPGDSFIEEDLQIISKMLAAYNAALEGEATDA